MSSARNGLLAEEYEHLPELFRVANRPAGPEGHKRLLIGSFQERRHLISKDAVILEHARGDVGWTSKHHIAHVVLYVLTGRSHEEVLHEWREGVFSTFAYAVSKPLEAAVCGPGESGIAEHDTAHKFAVAIVQEERDKPSKAMPDNNDRWQPQLADEGGDVLRGLACIEGWNRRRSTPAAKVDSHATVRLAEYVDLGRPAQPVAGQTVDEYEWWVAGSLVVVGKPDAVEV